MMGADPQAAAARRRQTGLSEADLSRRDVLAGSVGAAALVALPSLVSAPRGRDTAGLNASSPTIQPHLFIFGIEGPDAHPGPSIQAARPPAVRRAAAAAPVMIATQLAALPAQSPDQRFLALAAVQQSSTAMQVILSIVDSSTAAIVARGNLDLPHVTAGSLLLVTPAFAADSATVGLVLSVTVPSNMRTISKLNPNTGQLLKVPTATWTSHHELAYFDVRSQVFKGPFNLADGPSLARVSVIADDKDLFLWTVGEAIAARSPKGFKSRLPIRPVPRLAAYPLGYAQARFSVATAEPWPVSGEPVTRLATGEIARLAYARTVQVYSPRTGRVAERTIQGLSVMSAKPGAPFMQSRPDGTVLLANPAIGSAVTADPVKSFETLAVIRFPPPAYPAGGPASKVALSPDGKALYVLGAAKTGGLAAYDVSSGTLVASYSHGEHYTGLYQISSDTLVATGATNPRLTFFTMALKPFSSLNTDLHVAAVF